MNGVGLKIAVATVMRVYHNSWWSLGTGLVLDQGVPMIGQAVLWMESVGGHEVVPTNGRVV